MSLINTTTLPIYQALYTWLVSKTDASFAIDVTGSAAQVNVAAGDLNVYNRIRNYFLFTAEQPDVIANGALVTALVDLINNDLVNDAELNKLDGTGAGTNAGVAAVNYADKYRYKIEQAFITLGFTPPRLDANANTSYPIRTYL